MRRWQIVLAATALLAFYSPNAIAGPGSSDNGGKVTVTVSGDKKSARANTSKPGTIVFPRVSGCRSWTVPGGTTVVDGETVVLLAQKWRSCPGHDGGRGIGQPFPVADFTPDGLETAVIRPESPVMRFHGAWFTQRVGYVFVDAAFGTRRTVAMEGDPGQADLVLEDAVFDPGISTKAGLDARTCTREEILAPYDSSREHVDQDSCSFIYYVSSFKQAGGRYVARLRFRWRVEQIRFASGAVENPANLILESDSPARPVLVEEIQSVVPCKSISANGCG